MKNKLFFNFLTLFFSVIFCLIILEIALSLFYPQKFRERIFLTDKNDNFDPVVGWTDYRNTTYRFRSSEFDEIVKINNDGYADLNWIRDKKNELRIISLGDSLTEGLQVPQEKRFTNELASKLNSDLYFEKKVSVLNFGINGYGTCNQYMVLINKSLQYNPDMVLVFFYINDFYDNVDTIPMRPKCKFNSMGDLVDFQAPTNIRTEEKLNFMEKIITNTQVGSFFMNKLRYSRLTFEISKRLGGRVTPERNVNMFSKKEEYKNRELMNSTFYILKGMNKYLKDKGIPFVIIYIPTSFQAQSSIWEGFVNKYQINESEYNLSISNSYLSEFTKRENINYLDLYPIFKKNISLDQEPLFFYQDRHLNEKGHTVVAHSVYEFILKNNLLNFYK